MWQLEYSPEAINYLTGNWPYTVTVYEAIKALANTPYGVPREGAHQEPDCLMWTTENHLVVYERNEPARGLRIITIKPLE